MKDMLDRLKGADPDTMWKIDYYAPDNLDIRQYEHHGIVDRFILDAIIQVVLQEAITSRGWSWRMQSFPSSDDRHPNETVCVIMRTKGVIWWDHKAVYAGSPAIALLAAYLSAIEGQS